MRSEPGRRLRLCLVNCALSAAFQALGHEILDLHPKPGVCDLPRLLQDKGFIPDILIQQESLGPRILLRGLETLECTKVFWSIDTHLNTFWQEQYARLFDLTLHQRQNWLAGLKLGLVNLQGFRLKQGLEEIVLAAQQAESQGATDKFLNALAVVDPDKTIRQALAMGLSNKPHMVGAQQIQPLTTAQRNTHPLS